MNMLNDQEMALVKLSLDAVVWKRLTNPFSSVDFIGLVKIDFEFSDISVVFGGFYGLDTCLGKVVGLIKYIDYYSIKPNVLIVSNGDTMLTKYFTTEYQLLQSLAPDQPFLPGWQGSGPYPLWS